MSGFGMWTEAYSTLTASSHELCCNCVHLYNGPYAVVTLIVLAQPRHFACNQATAVPTWAHLLCTRVKNLCFVFQFRNPAWLLPQSALPAHAALLAEHTRTVLPCMLGSHAQAHSSACACISCMLDIRHRPSLSLSFQSVAFPLHRAYSCTVLHLIIDTFIYVVFHHLQPDIQRCTVYVCTHPQGVSM